MVKEGFLVPLLPSPRLLLRVGLLVTGRWLLLLRMHFCWAPGVGKLLNNSHKTTTD